MKTPVQRRYQLVFQFPSSSIGDYDTFISLESDFQKAIRGGAFVDGHDSGSGEFNIFVHTDTPGESLIQLKPVLSAARQLTNVRVAYREFGGDTYSLVWPEGDSAPFRVA